MDYPPISLTAILDEIPLGISLLSEDFRIIYLNRALEALTGFSRREVEGVRCAHVLRCSICFENCPARKPVPGNVSLEGDIVNQDHRKIPVRLTFSPIRQSGKLTGFVETIENTRLLRETEQKHEAVLGIGRIVPAMRELKNIIEYTISICETGRIEPSHLPAYLMAPAPESLGKEDGEKEGPPAFGFSAGGAPDLEEQGGDWAAIEREMILDALIRAKGRRNKAAALLGWGRSTLWRKMKRYRMDA